MTDREKIADAEKNKWMEDTYKAYKAAYYYYNGSYFGCLSYRSWLAIRIDMYKPNYKSKHG